MSIRQRKAAEDASDVRQADLVRQNPAADVLRDVHAAAAMMKAKTKTESMMRSASVGRIFVILCV
jgi:hypothetical protein